MPSAPILTIPRPASVRLIAASNRLVPDMSSGNPLHAALIRSAASTRALGSSSGAASRAMATANPFSEIAIVGSEHPSDPRGAVPSFWPVMASSTLMMRFCVG